MTGVLQTYELAIGRAARAERDADKPVFDLDALQGKEREAIVYEIWPDLARYCHNPCDAIFAEHVDRSMYSDDVRQEHYRRRKERAELRRELRTEGAPR